MEKQEKAYKGVIEYFKNRIMAGELVRGEASSGAGDCADAGSQPQSVREAVRIMDMTGSDFLPAGIGELHHL